MKTGKIKCENQLVFIISNLSTDSGLTFINFNSRRGDNFSRLSEGAEESLAIKNLVPPLDLKPIYTMTFLPQQCPRKTRVLFFPAETNDWGQMKKDERQ